MSFIKLLSPQGAYTNKESTPNKLTTNTTAGRVSPIVCERVYGFREAVARSQSGESNDRGGFYCPARVLTRGVRFGDLWRGLEVICRRSLYEMVLLLLSTPIGFPSPAQCKTRGLWWQCSADDTVTLACLPVPALGLEDTVPESCPDAYAWQW